MIIDYVSNDEVLYVELVSSWPHCIANEGSIGLFGVYVARLTDDVPANQTLRMLRSSRRWTVRSSTDWKRARGLVLCLSNQSRSLT